MYEIKPYTYKKAKELDLIVFPAENKKNKLQVYSSNGLFLHNIGDIKYYDFPAYLQMENNGIVPKGYAETRRKLYHKRHNKQYEKNSKGYLAKELLW